MKEVKNMPPKGLVLEVGKKYLLWNGKVETAEESGIATFPFALGEEEYTSDGYFHSARAAALNVRREVETPSRICLMTVESDPDSIDQHAPGAKLDMGKPDYDIFFRSFAHTIAYNCVGADLQHVGTLCDVIAQHRESKPAIIAREFLELTLRNNCSVWPEINSVAIKGAEKYCKFGFLAVDDGPNRWWLSALRHAMALLEGEVIDPDFGLPHSAHLLWNMAAILECSDTPA